MPVTSTSGNAAVQLETRLVARSASGRSGPSARWLLLAVVVWLAQSAAAALPTPRDLPSPTAGPGVPPLTRSQHKKVDKALRKLADGNLSAARKQVARAGDAPAATLLGHQIDMVEGTDADGLELVTFCRRNPSYAAAWITLSIDAENRDDEPLALAAARRGAELWPDSRWAGRAAELEERWVVDRIARARQLLDEGRTDAALAELVPARELDRNRPELVLLEAEILYAAGRLEPARALLDRIADLPEAQALAGAIAEEKQDWQAAMEHYSELPEGYPGRAAALHRAQFKWRMTLLPGYARDALSSRRLTRGQLAVILVAVYPRLETLQGGEVPVMSDIVDQPGHREIITVVRLGIMNADRRGHLFAPDREAAPATIRGAVERTRSLVGLPAPVWCAAQDVVGSDCIPIPSPASGATIVNAVLDGLPGEGHDRSHS